MRKKNYKGRCQKRSLSKCDARLTLTDFEKILLHCIIYYNSQRVIENFPYTEDMLQSNVKPYSSDIWNYGLKQVGTNLIPIDIKKLILTLLPRTVGRFTRKGLDLSKSLTFIISSDQASVFKSNRQVEDASNSSDTNFPVSLSKI